MSWGAKPIDPIAVVGIDCRLPGADDKNAFWDLLLNGGSGIVEVPADRWDATAFYSTDGRAGTSNTKMAGLIADPGVFDHAFFGISPREAAEMDPQQRLLLQSCWRAIEDSVVDPASLRGSRTGVYVGVMSSEWALLHMADYSSVTPQRGTGNGYHMVANRISYHLDFKGPSVAVDTACSSSLVAVHMAAAALGAGDCDVAVAAGVNLILTPALSIFYTQAGLSAPDGQCKPFSPRADGIGRGEGVGVVVLRRLQDALAHNQPVYAVIEGSAVSHDGRSNGITAPNRWSQQQVIGSAYARAGVRPSEVSFVEAHGTGTRLGDMIEVKALGAVHAVDREELCALGSVKGNIGHAEGAAGIAGLIKACLALDRRTLPPSLHSGDENANLRLVDHGLRLAREPIPLPDGPVHASVSSFGLGGTNAHVVLSAPPVAQRRPDRGGVSVLTVSANTSRALQRNLGVIAGMVEDEQRGCLSQVCYSTNLVKSSMPYRFALAASSRNEIIGSLREQLREPPAPKTPSAPPRVVFLFTGQGTQYPGMTRPLYESCPPYRERLDEVVAAMRPHLGSSIASVLFGGGQHDRDAINDTALAQPALFAVGYALGSALRDLGIWPHAVLGHGLGEYAAAALTGVLTLSDACRVVVARGRLTAQLARRSRMLAVRASAEAVRPIADAEQAVTIAEYNSPRDVVLSGGVDALGRVEAALREAGVASERLGVSHAFHSPLMESIVPELARVFDGLSPSPTAVPFASSHLGRFVTGEELGPNYWAEQVAAPVRFESALRSLLELELAPTHLLEVGPVPALLSFARRAGIGRKVGGLVPCPGAAATGREVAKVLVELYRGGLAPRWDRLYTDDQKVPRRLPPFAFADDNRFWKALPTPPHTSSSSPQPRSEAPTGRAAGSLAHQVLEALADLGGYPVSDLPLDARLAEDLGYDSITLMRLTERLAKLLDADEPLRLTELLPRLTTVGDVLSYVRQHAS